MPAVDYWSRVKEFDQLWERHVERWPRAPESGERDLRRPDDPPGSWRGEGGRYLAPEQNAEADRLIAALRAPEKEITALMQAIEQDNTYGGRLAGLDHRLKGTHRLKEKIVDTMMGEVGSNLSDAINEISDAVRYSFRIDGANYVKSYHDIRARLQSFGCQMVYGRNHWVDDPQYKGVNTRWLTPTGSRFELQFHTRESLHAKEHLTHNSYRRLRALDTSRAEQRELKAFQNVVSGALAKPPEVKLIEDRKKTPK